MNKLEKLQELINNTIESLTGLYADYKIEQWLHGYRNGLHSGHEITIELLKKMLEDPTMQATGPNAEGYRQALLDIKKELGIK